MKNYNDKLMLGYFGHDGKLHKVERLDKITEIKGIISDEVQRQSPLPEYIEPLEFSCEVECPEEFVRKFKDQMKKIDLMILDGYDNVAKSIECCLGDNERCGECVFFGEKECMSHLMQSVMHIIKSQREFVARAIEEKWK